MPSTAPDARADESAALHRVAGLLTEAIPLETIGATGIAEMARCVGAQTASIFRFDAPDAPTLLSSWGARLESPPSLHDELRSVHRTGLSSRSSSQELGADTSSPTARSWVLAPIVVGGRVWGTMCASSARSEFAAGTESRMAGFADLLAVAVAHERVRADLELLAEEQEVLQRLAVLVARGATGEVTDVHSPIAQLQDPSSNLSSGFWRLPAGGARVAVFCPEHGRMSHQEPHHRASGERASNLGETGGTSCRYFPTSRALVGITQTCWRRGRSRDRASGASSPMSLKWAQSPRFRYRTDRSLSNSPELSSRRRSAPTLRQPRRATRVNRGPPNDTQKLRRRMQVTIRARCRPGSAPVSRTTGTAIRRTNSANACSARSTSGAVLRMMRCPCWLDIHHDRGSRDPRSPMSGWAAWSAQRLARCP